MTDAGNATRLGDYIRNKRTSHGLTIRQLAASSGIPSSTLGRLEHGEIARPRPDILHALSTAFDSPLEKLFLLVGYEPIPAQLPLERYLALRYADELSPEAVKRAVRFLDELIAEEGLSPGGPQDGEDEDI
jgi:transcriptional regulator with XRE-family HTH domain